MTTKSKIDNSKPTISCKEIIDIYKEIKVEYAFQRKGGWEKGSGWPKEKFPKYIDSILAGQAANGLMLLPIEKTKDLLIEREDPEQYANSFDYYEEAITKGWKYLSIDGNNSGSAIFNYYNNEFPDSKGRYYKDLPNYLQELFLKREIRYQELLGASLEEACEQFRLLNSSEALLAHEHRQARISPLSEFIRDLGSSHSGMLHNFIFNDPANIDRRHGDELIAKYAYREHYNCTSKALNKATLDEFYENIIDLPNDCKQTIKKTLSIMSAISCKIGALPKSVKKGTFFGLAAVVKHLNEQKYVIKEYEQFMKWFLDDYVKFNADSNKVTQEELAEKSYKYWQGRMDTYYYSIEKKHLQSLEESLDSLEEHGIISSPNCSKTRSSKDSFTEGQKMQVLVEQGFKDRNGNEISALDLLRGNLHADHLTSVKDGGKTVIENCEMMKKEDNLKKGSNSNLPFFEHQKT